MTHILPDRTLGLLALVAVIGCNSGVQRIDYSVEKLTKTLQDKDPHMRYWAAESLGNYGPAAHVAIPNLIKTLKDDDKTVRMGAAYALAAMGPAAAEARAALIEASKDPEKEVRDGATYALKQIASKATGKRPKS
jgi:HEAT repeat protein